MFIFVDDKVQEDTVILQEEQTFTPIKILQKDPRRHSNPEKKCNNLHRSGLHEKHRSTHGISSASCAREENTKSDANFRQSCMRDEIRIRTQY